MITYKDRSFCTWGILCKKHINCYRYMSERGRQKAIELGLPILYTTFKDCFVPFFEEEEE